MGLTRPCVATGNTQLKVYHKLLSNPGMRYEDLGPDYYERQRDTRRQVAHHVGKLGSLGFEVTLVRIPEAARGTGPAPGHLTHTAPQALTDLDGQGPLPHAQLISIFRVRRLGVRVPPSAPRGYRQNWRCHTDRTVVVT